MDVGGYFAIARRWWLVLVASVVLAAFGGFVAASTLPKVYDAQVRVLVGPVNTDLQTQRASGQLANTYAQLVTSRRITDAVAQRLGSAIQGSDLVGTISAVPNDVTRLIAIRVESGDPSKAAAIANAVAAELTAVGAESGRPEGRIDVIDPAQPRTTPIAPQVSLLVLLAAFAGLVIAISGIVLVEYLRDSFRSPDELRELSNAPILGRLRTRVSRRRDVASALIGSGIGDEYRSMTARIEQLAGAEIRTLLLVGVQPDRGPGVVATGLALGFADRGISTALVDADVDNPAATVVLAAQNRALGETGEAASRVSVVSRDRSQGRRSVVLTMAPRAPGGDLGRVEDVEQLLDELRDSAELVVIVAPPLDRSHEATLWARLADAIVLVVADRASRRQIESNMDVLRLAGLSLLGTIVIEAGPAGRVTRRRGPSVGSPSFGAPPRDEVLSAEEVTVRTDPRPRARERRTR